MWKFFTSLLLHGVAAVPMIAQQPNASAEPTSGSFEWNVRTRPDLASVFETRRWESRKTAFIVCDMWDYHHSVNAVRRLKQFAPRLDAVLAEARRRGATIIHAPSDCMPFYKEHAARQRALAVPKAAQAPVGISDWCHRIPEEERATYPIDQSNGGEDDDLMEHRLWAAYLESIGRNPGTPWMRQTDLLTIDAERDYISSEGEVVWNILEARGIDHVVLTGVHTNMCVLGRPFGLRQMKRAGKEVLLMRDMTDVMYEPNSWPYVSHFTGIDLVIEHIERYVCPTVTSDQVLAGKAFRFSGDRRPRAAILWNPPEADPSPRPQIRGGSLIGRDLTRRSSTSVAWLKEQLQATFQVHIVSGEGADLDSADVLIDLAVPRENDSAVAAFEMTGRPVVIESRESATTGIERVRSTDEIPNPDHPLLTNWEPSLRIGRLDVGSLKDYRSDTVEVVFGSERAPSAWIRVRPDGGSEFGVMPRGGDPRFIINATHYAVGLEVPRELREDAQWNPAVRWINVRMRSPMRLLPPVAESSEPSWWRCQVLLPHSWGDKGIAIESAFFGDRAKVFFNGNAIENEAGEISNDQVTPGALNTLAFRLEPSDWDTARRKVPVLRNASGDELSLEGRWQVRLGDDPSWATLPIPPQFGASTDHIFEVQAASSKTPKD